MANKRMFSKQITSSDAFMDMPTSSQLLYFHFVMEADDEGFIGNPKKIMRMVGVSSDDFKILEAKRFILTFESGVIVIKHWLIHNAIRMDRFNATSYQEEKKCLQIKDNKAYTELATTRQPDGNQLAGQVKLSKVNLSEVNISKDIVASDKSIYGEFKNVKLLEEEYKKLIDKFGEKNTDILISELSTYMASKGKRYSNHYATLLNWGKRKIQDYQNNNKPKRTII